MGGGYVAGREYIVGTRYLVHIVLSDVTGCATHTHSYGHTHTHTHILWYKGTYIHGESERSAEEPTPSGFRWTAASTYHDTS